MEKLNTDYSYPTYLGFLELLINPLTNNFVEYPLVVMSDCVNEIGAV